MKSIDVGLVAASTSRSKAYIQAMLANGLKPSFVILLHDPSKGIMPGQRGEDLSPGQRVPQVVRELDLEIDFAKPEQESLREADVPWEVVTSLDINSDAVHEALAGRPEKVIVYSGVGGMILRDRILSAGKRFLHVHGGYLPDYKGSTTNYYSFLDGHGCGAASIFMEREIDCGPVLVRNWYPSPKDLRQLEYSYDAICRARTLVSTLKRYLETGGWTMDLEKNEGGETYYIIHPLLRHIAFLSEKDAQ